jgi:hypothetical protein
MSPSSQSELFESERESDPGKIPPLQRAAALPLGEKSSRPLPEKSSRSTRPACGRKTRSTRPGSPHSKKHNLIACAVHTTEFQTSTPQYCLREPKRDATPAPLRFGKLAQAPGHDFNSCPKPPNRCGVVGPCGPLKRHDLKPCHEDREWTGALVSAWEPDF